VASANAFNQGWVRELPSFRGGSAGSMFTSQKSDWPNASFMKVLMALTVQLDQTGLDCYGTNTTGKGGRIANRFSHGQNKKAWSAGFARTTLGDMMNSPRAHGPPEPPWSCRAPSWWAISCAMTRPDSVSVGRRVLMLAAALVQAVATNATPMIGSPGVARLLAVMRFTTSY